MWRLMHDPKSCTRGDVMMIFFNEPFYKAKVPHGGVFGAWHSELPDDPQIRTANFDATWTCACSTTRA